MKTKRMQLIIIILVIVVIVAICSSLAILPKGVQASSWWLAGGISPANVLVAYQPLLAADLAASYTNLANPGTNDAAPGLAPDWSSGDGWIFNGVDQYLSTGTISIDQNVTLIIRIADFNFSGYAYYSGASDGSASNNIYLGEYQTVPEEDIFRGAFGDATAEEDDDHIPSGILAINKNYLYKDGYSYISWGTVPGDFSFDLPVFIGAENDSSVPSNYANVKVLAYALYNIPLSDAQVLAITTAMNGIDDWGTETSTPSITNTPTFTRTPTSTETSTETYTPSFTPSDTATFTFTPSITDTPSFTPSLTPTIDTTLTTLTPTMDVTKVYDFYSAKADDNLFLIYLLGGICGLGLLGGIVTGVVWLVTRRGS